MLVCVKQQIGVRFSCLPIDGTVIPQSEKENQSKAFPDILKIELPCQMVRCAQQRTIGKNSKGCLEKAVN